VKAELVEHPTLMHDFYIMASVAPAVLPAISRAATAVKKALG